MPFVFSRETAGLLASQRFMELEKKIRQVQQPGTALGGLTDAALEELVERRAEGMFNRWLEKH